MKQIQRRETPHSKDRIPILSNFFKFDLKLNCVLYKYSVDFEPPISEQDSRFRSIVIRSIASQISERLGKFVFSNTMLYTSNSHMEQTHLVFNSTANGQNYTVTIKPAGEVTQIKDTVAFYNKLFNSVQSKLNLAMIGRKFFNPSRAMDLPNHQISIWPGYTTSVSSFEAGCLVNIDIAHRCLRMINVYQQMEHILSNGTRETVESELLNTIVVTTYNNRHYRIDAIMWDMTPESTFETTEGTSIQFKDYYAQYWRKQIRAIDQPLLKCERRNPIYLIPELCIQTGLSDEMRSNFVLMRDMSNITKKTPAQRLEESQNLITDIQSNPQASREMAEWNVTLNPEPISLEGKVLDSGSISMGNDQNFRISEQGMFDRDLQNPLYDQPFLDTWGVIYCKKNQNLCNSFTKNLQEVSKSFKLKCKPPVMFTLDTERWEDWDSKLRSILSPKVKILICVLTGYRGKSKLYDSLKMLTLSNLPVPTQVVLTGTLKKENSLKSVASKILIQIVAKTEGSPWIMRSLPLTDMPTMVVGMDIYHKVGSASVLGFVASTDRKFSKYASFPVVNATGEEICSKLSELVYEAMVEFNKDNGAFPSRIVVFRDGVGEGQRSTVLASEVPQFTAAFEKLTREGHISEHPKLCFAIVSKRINARFYSRKGNQIVNPPLGTCVDKEVVSTEYNEFFLCPARATQGVMTPTNFVLVYNNTGCSYEDIQLLAYRMCFVYYNWSGSIRVPAPCQYAHKLAYHIGERIREKGLITPHPSWKQRRSLYFL